MRPYEEEAQASFGPKGIASATGSPFVVYWMSGPLPGPTPFRRASRRDTRYVTGKKIPPLHAMSTWCGPLGRPGRRVCPTRTDLSRLGQRRYDLVALKNMRQGCLT